MARARFPDDAEAAEIAATAAFEVEETVAYSRDDELYGPYVEGMGEEAESAVAQAVAEERERAAKKEEKDMLCEESVEERGRAVQAALLRETATSAQMIADASVLRAHADADVTEAQAMLAEARVQLRESQEALRLIASGMQPPTVDAGLIDLDFLDDEADGLDNFGDDEVLG
jgi:hypothetical protein